MLDAGDIQQQGQPGQPAARAVRLSSVDGQVQELTTPASKAYIDKLHAKYGQGIPYVSELACATYEGVHIWAEGVRKAGTVDRMTSSTDGMSTTECVSGLLDSWADRLK